METNNCWVVIVGRPVKKFWGDKEEVKQHYYYNVGRIIRRDGIQLSFNTRAEARKVAKEYARDNRYWRYHVKKIIVKG